MKLKRVRYSSCREPPLRSESLCELRLFLIDLSMVRVRGLGDGLGGIVSHSFSSTHDRSWLRTITA
ncbi:hypothetical protein AtNW77_Chr5g0123861 [Arabidopsis thaliana]|uniref:Uncharacterized protein n=1 Tax=Arabidopsis thaliana x Arabidopsis arenosa TaxID=1240361 RepID=A0A8T2DBS6_9BRAS|nr:hypothetical protein ISN45_At05g035940 [Arabidopsis thaliana x Arabidopsis arenosa]